MKTKRKIGLVTVMIALCIALLCAAVPVNAAEKYCTSVEEAAQIVREAMVGREAEGQLGQEAEGQRWPVGLSPEAGHQDQEGSCLL